MWESYLIKGLTIGLLFGMPVGVVGALTIQRVLNFGPKAGMLSGMGSSVADALYACIGAFGVTFISDFLLRRQNVVHILGACIILLMGLKIVMTKPEMMKKGKENTASLAKMFFSSFVVTITNPAAILTFLFVFSYFGISGKLETINGVQLVAGIFFGTVFWWGLLAVLVSIFRKKVSSAVLKKVNQGFGAILILFGISILLRTIL